jgi:glycogen debranching enzyme
MGLRSLADGHPDFAPRYRGGPAERDAVYHQGTVWPWLIGPFVEAWVRVRGGGAKWRDQARAAFVDPLIEHLAEAGVGHISEIADAEAPHSPGGCPFQAWSLGELLRLQRVVLSGSTGDARPGRGDRSRARSGLGLRRGRVAAFPAGT